MTYDAIVVGLGGMGSAAAARLAERGRRVLGIEQFARGHDRGASSGQTRIIRQAYFEDPAYVPLLLRAYELWRDLEAQTGATVLDLCGILMVGQSDGEILAGALRSAREHHLPVETFDAPGIVDRYPATTPLATESAILEANAGMVFPEVAIAAHCSLAEHFGAELRFGTGVARYSSDANGVSVELADGNTIDAENLVLTAGPWMRDLVTIGLPIRVQRNVQLWFEPQTAAYGRDRFPGFFLQRAGMPSHLYGFPDYGEGVKAALHAYGDTTDPDNLDRTIRDHDVALVRDALDAWMPGAAGRLIRGKACMYALTPDEHFIIDRLPAEPRVTIAGGFSGHGFKFCSVVGEILADLSDTGTTRHPIDFLRLDRFANAAV